MISKSVHNGTPQATRVKNMIDPLSRLYRLCVIIEAVETMTEDDLIELETVIKQLQQRVGRIRRCFDAQEEL